MLGRSTTPAMLAILFLAAAVAPRATAAGISAQAWIGRPFGVGRIEIELPDAALPEPLGLAGIGLSEKSGRVFYPALETPPGMPGMVKDILNQSRRPLVRMFSDILTNSGPPKATLYFLFRGDQPLELLLRTKAADAFVTVPAVAPLGIQPQLLAWWRAYTAQPGLLQKKPDYPPVVESYLQSMLARRLDLPPPAPRPGGSWEETFEHQIALTLGTEVARLAIVEQLGPAQVGGQEFEILERDARSGQHIRGGGLVIPKARLEEILRVGVIREIPVKITAGAGLPGKIIQKRPPAKFLEIVRGDIARALADVPMMIQGNVYARPA